MRQEFEETRGGYGMRYYFNAGTDKRTLKTDEEGTEFYDEDTGEYVGSVEGYTPEELVEMDESEFQSVLNDNYIE